MQDPEQDLVSNGQDPVDLAAGKGRVQEEANLDVLLGRANLLTEHGRQQHQMIIVHPDQIAILDILDDGLGKQPIGFSVCVPGHLVKGNLPGMVVEEWPQGRVYRSGP